jgi:hypothetical protein
MFNWKIWRNQSDNEQNRLTFPCIRRVAERQEIKMKRFFQKVIGINVPEANLVTALKQKDTKLT